jgi:hypothetical protein
MTVGITLCPEIALGVTGTYSKGEPEVNIGESFEIKSIDLVEYRTLYDLLEWTDAQDKNTILSKIEDLCIEAINS